MGLSKDISFVDINETYYPTGLGQMDEKMRTKDECKTAFYATVCKFLDDYEKRLRNRNTDDNSQQPS